jgi:hypothetical protein
LTQTENATVTITDNADPTTQTVNLTGTGTGSVVSLSPSSYTFPTSQFLGTTSPSETITLTNTGNLSLTINSITMGGTNSGDFAQTNNCLLPTNTVAPNGGSCTIAATFTPTSSGTRTAAISIADNATAGSPQAVTLSGTGTSATVGFSPSSLTFGNQTVNTSSAATAVTLTNSGTGVLTINSIQVTPATPANFGQTNNCGSTVPASGGNCTIEVTFSPTTAGSLTAAVSVSDTASGSPQAVPLSGTGGAPEAVLSVSTLTFGSTTQGVPVLDPSSAVTQSVTLQNNGNATLNITNTGAISGSNPADFTITAPCDNSTLTASSSCQIMIAYEPQVYPSGGISSATLTITDNNNNASGSTQTVSLTGYAEHDIVLTWTYGSTSGISGFDIYRGTTSGGETLTYTTTVATSCTTTSTSASCTYVDTAVAAGTYYYYVTAVALNGITQSVPSTPASATVP